MEVRRYLTYARYVGRGLIQVLDAENPGEKSSWGGTRGRGEVSGQAGVAEACAYTLEGVSKGHKSKMTTNSSNSATSCLSQYLPLHPSTTTQQISFRNGAFLLPGYSGTRQECS